MFVVNNLFANDFVFYQGKVFVNQKEYKLKKPLLLYQGELFVSSDSLANLFNGKQIQKYRQLGYEVNLPSLNITCLFLERSKEWWLFDQRHFFDRTTFIDKGYLYIPFKEFATRVGLVYQYDEKQLNLQVDLSQTNKLTQKRLQLLHLNRVDKDLYAKPVPDILQRLPQLKRGKQLYIRVHGSSYPFNFFFYQADQPYVYIEDILKREGYRCQLEKNRYTIYKDQKKYIFSSQSRMIEVVENGKKIILSGVGPVLIKGSRTYIPLENLLSAFDCTMAFDISSKTYVMQSKIQAMYWQKKGMFPVLNVLSSHPVTPKFIRQGKLKEGYYLQFPDSVSAMFDNHIKSPHPFLKWSWLYAKKEHTILFLRAGLYSVKPLSMNYSWGNQFRFHGTLIDVHEYEKKDKYTVKIKGSKKAILNSWHTQKDGKLVLDFSDTYSELPTLIRSNNDAFHRIRMSQFRNEPPVSRVIFDLKKDTNARWEIRQTGTDTYVDFFVDQTKLVAQATKIKKKEIVPQVIKKKKNVFIKQPTKKKKKRISKGLAHKVIVIDPGHGGRDPGSIGLGKEYEKRYTLDVAKRVKRILESKGAYVVLTRSNDVTRRLPTRTRMANRKKADVFVSLHFNSFSKNKAHGTETYYYKYKDKRLARTMHQALTKNLGLKNNGIRRSRFYVLRHSSMPAVLLEPAYMTHSKNLLQIKSPVFRQKLAESIAKGLENYFLL